ncbi:kinase-like domain-containing protein [Aspergillus coremiiformis]|uniref:Kinase-like domain-containing protein n=1 Tax=Aspergillus coremiiformis TaxID=138285 RepID=A0A5N6YXG5_9EURO|nr:kinase-like domain-containing protein [Aspergillus coremiiformis]
MMNKLGRVQLTPSMIPNSPNFDVKDSTFFSKWSQLPSPKEVRAQAEAQNLLGVNPDNRKIHSSTIPSIRPPPVIFKNMRLFIKWGSAVRISEAQCLYTVRRFLQDNVPVPEVYGWRTDADEKFIYMEYTEGQTLEKIWDVMESHDRVSICHELRIIYDNLRRLEQDLSDPFIGKIAFHINYMSEAGPFATVRDFHDWFTFLHRRPMSDPYSIPVEPFRHDLPDNSTIKLTHGDLHRSNIIITSLPPYRTLAIVDWEQSGWLPAYWEARKAQYTADRSEEWSIQHLPIILDQYPNTWDPWDYYTMAMGC